MNILRYKQQAQNWMPRDDTGSDTGNSTSNNSPVNSQKDSDSSPGAAEASGAFNNTSGGLSTMFSGNYGGYQTGSSLNSTTPAQAQSDQAQYASPTSPSWAQRMGIIPGMTTNQFFDQNSPSQQADRMGMVGTGIGAVGNALTNAMMPGPLRMALGGLSAYNNYQRTGDAGQSMGIGLSSLPGYAGASGQALQGNYGTAMSRVAGLNGASPLNSGLAGMGVDAANGVDVTPSAYSLGGMYAGNRLGGQAGGVLGNQLGNQFAKLQGYK